MKDAVARARRGQAFVRYYLENATALAEEQQFVPAPQAALDEATREGGLLT